jgi:hypothetical protein
MPGQRPLEPHDERFPENVADLPVLDDVPHHGLRQLGDTRAQDLAGGSCSAAEREVGAHLPEAFFDYQDALTISVAELSAAAQLEDDIKLVEAFGKVAQTCVACHSAYLHEDLAPEHDDLGVDDPTVSALQ